jgi:hypothetical protein
LVTVDHQSEPTDVVDRLLWRDAQQILSRHTEPIDGQCLWCGRQWPCAPRRLAENAEAASRRPWNEAWTARHDLYSLRSMPGWRVDLGATGRQGGWHRAGGNRGTFL